MLKHLYSTFEDTIYCKVKGRNKKIKINVYFPQENTDDLRTCSVLRLQIGQGLYTSPIKDYSCFLNMYMRGTSTGLNCFLLVVPLSQVT